MTTSSLGLYIHIPFCSRLCHYCDFAKTANYTTQHTTQYFRILEAQLLSWIRDFSSDQKLSSVFLGGGTPGLFSKEYNSLFRRFEPFLEANAEITLEANPQNINIDALLHWRSIGINRISIGVQTFDPDGLVALTRDHSGDDAIKAIDEARSIIQNVNADLIYGWPGQTFESWNADLRQITRLGVPHLSLYALTFEGNTPFARANRRGKLPATPDETQEHFYLHAKQVLSQSNYDHDEISNWSKSGFSCRHNWLYWRGERFIGIGAGAHGYVHDQNQSFVGMRYSYPGNLRQYLRDCEPGGKNAGMQIDHERGPDEWLMEYVGCALRTNEGVDLNLVRKHGWNFAPNSIVTTALQENILLISNGIIALEPKDWFRETAWSGQILDSLQKI